MVKIVTPGPRSSAVARHADAQRMRELSIDLAQIALDVAGLVDPTPICDGLNAVIAVGRGNWVDAGLSVISIVPYVGDLAKAGKFPKYLKTLEKAIAIANESADAAKVLTPIVERVDKALALLPTGGNRGLDAVRKKTGEYLNKVAAQGGRRYPLPDVSSQIRFRKFRRGDNEYKQAVGRLGVPGQVKTHRSTSAQSAVSKGTGDDAGHLVGNQFGASGGPENLSLQNWQSNRYGTYKQLESVWAAKLKSGTGIEVKVIDVTKAGDSRPFKRSVRWTEIGPSGSVTRYELDFANPHTPRSRTAQDVPATVSRPQEDNVIFVDFERRQRIR